MTAVAHQAQKGYRPLRLALAEHAYARFVSEKRVATERLAEISWQYPALLPERPCARVCVLWLYVMGDRT